MTRRITPAFGLLVPILVLALVQTGVRAQQEGLALLPTGLPTGLVTATRLETRIAETEADTALEAAIKDQLVAL